MNINEAGKQYDSKADAQETIKTTRSEIKPDVVKKKNNKIKW